MTLKVYKQTLGLKHARRLKSILMPEYRLKIYKPICRGHRAALVVQLYEVMKDAGRDHGTKEKEHENDSRCQVAEIVAVSVKSFQEIPSSTAVIIGSIAFRTS